MSTYKVIDTKMAESLLITRRQNNIPLSKMADQTEITRDTLSKIERGNKQVVQSRIYEALYNWLIIMEHPLKENTHE